MYLTHRTTEEPQAGQPSKCLNGRSYGERLAKEAFWSPAKRGLKKDCDRAITSVAEAVRVPAYLVPPGSPQAKQLYHLHAQISLGQSCHRQKNSSIYACRVTAEKNQRWHKQVERYFMFLGRKNQYCENEYTTKCNLQIQCNPYQITNGIFHRTRTKNFTIHMET